jgi:hypothetical protein
LKKWWMRRGSVTRGHILYKFCCYRKSFAILHIDKSK